MCEPAGCGSFADNINQIAFPKLTNQNFNLISRMTWQNLLQFFKRCSFITILADMFQKQFFYRVKSSHTAHLSIYLRHNINKDSIVLLHAIIKGVPTEHTAHGIADQTADFAP